jgi:hypothetical protein
MLALFKVGTPQPQAAAYALLEIRRQARADQAL